MSEPVDIRASMMAGQKILIAGPTVDNGICGECHRRIILGKQEADATAAEVIRLTRPRQVEVKEGDPLPKPKWIIPLPPFPCGHSYKWVQRLTRHSDGTYWYE